MPFYADFSSETVKNDFKAFVVGFFSDCECMAEIFEGMIFTMMDGHVIEIYVKDLAFIEYGNDYIVFNFKEIAKQRDIILKYDNIAYAKIIEPNYNRWEGSL